MQQMGLQFLRMLWAELSTPQKRLFIVLCGILSLVIVLMCALMVIGLLVVLTHL